MGTTTVRTQIGAGIGSTPLLRPVTASVITVVVRIQIQVIVPFRIITFNICKVEKDFIVVTAIFSNHLVFQMQITARAGAIKMTGHVDKTHCRVLGFELMHCSEIGLDVLRRIRGYLATPGPHGKMIILCCSHCPGSVQTVICFPVVLWCNVGFRRVAVVHAQGRRIFNEGQSL